MTAAAGWLDLLPCADPEWRRQWLGERGAFECAARGVRDVGDPASWPVVAEVLALVLGDWRDVIEGELG